MSWALRLKRVFNIDIETCREYGGAVKVIAYIEDPEIIKRFSLTSVTKMPGGGPACSLEGGRRLRACLADVPIVQPRLQPPAAYGTEVVGLPDGMGRKVVRAREDTLMARMDRISGLSKESLAPPPPVNNRLTGPEMGVYVSYIRDQTRVSRNVEDLAKATDAIRETFIQQSPLNSESMTSYYYFEHLVWMLDIQADLPGKWLEEGDCREQPL
jgi:hypothetical protein